MTTWIKECTESVCGSYIAVWQIDLGIQRNENIFGSLEILENVWLDRGSLAIWLFSRGKSHVHKQLLLRFCTVADLDHVDPGGEELRADGGQVVVPEVHLLQGGALGHHPVHNTAQRIENAALNDVKLSHGQDAHKIEKV